MVRLPHLGFIFALVTACSGGHPVVQEDAGVEVEDAGAPDAGAKCRPACSGMQTCVDGHCVLPTCDATETRCGVNCIDTQTNKQHCGACGHLCPLSSPECSGGQCGILCEGSGEFCPVTSRCIEGHCCPAGTAVCDNACVHIDTDLNNCGGCGQLCSANSHGTATCTAGNCHLTCETDYVICQNQCSDLKTDNANCGECGHSCHGRGCLGGKCIITSTTCDVSASGGWHECNGVQTVGEQGLQMSASGTWKVEGVEMGPTGQAANPVSCSICYDPRLDPNSNYGALLWTIDGDFIPVAFTSATSSAFHPTAGKVLFRSNDDDLLSGLTNDGNLQVTVVVTEP